MNRRLRDFAREIFTLICLLAIVPVAVIGSLGGGCHKRTLDTESLAPAASSVRLSPAKLFSGDLRRIEPHLGLTASGCVHVEITGPDLMLGLETELRRDGKRVRSLGSGSSRTRESGDLSFSMTEITDAEGNKRFRIVEAMTGKFSKTSMTPVLDLPEQAGGTMRGTTEFGETLDLPEGQYVPVWAYVVHKDMKHPVLSPIEAAAESARWALVIKLRWERADVVGREP